MRKVSYPDGEMAGEESLINELARKQGIEQSLLQQCNDEYELIHVEFHKKQDGKLVVDGKGNFLPAECPFSYLRLKRALRAQKTLSFVTVDSMVKERVDIIEEPTIEDTVFVAEMENGGFAFLGEQLEDPKKGVLVDYKSKTVVNVKARLPKQGCQAILIFPVDDRLEGEALKKELLKTMGGGKIILVTGMEMPSFVRKRGQKIDLVKKSVLVNDYVIFNDNFSDVCDIIPKINKWEDVSFWGDIGTGEPFYNREVNELLLYSVIYSKAGRSVFNLILSGVPSTAKTSCITEYARVFADDGRVVQATGSTTKGLIPSFFGDTPQAGYLASPGFLKVVDELFRSVSMQHENKSLYSMSGALGEFLSKLLPVLTRKPQIFSSAKSDSFVVKMTASLIATDNLVDSTRVGLANQVEGDPAVLRRMTIIFLNDEEKDRVKRASVVPTDDEVHELISARWKKVHGYDLAVLRRFAEWARLKLEGVAVDSMRCFKIAESIWMEVLRGKLQHGMLDDDKIRGLVRKLDFVDHVRALVECCAMFRSVCTEKEKKLPEVVVDESDYEDAARIFQRIVEDCSFLFNQNFADHLLYSSGSPHIGGVKRV